MGRLRRLRPWPVLPPSPFGLRRTSRDGAIILRLPILRDARPSAALLRMRQIEGRASSATRLTRGMAGFVVNNNESTRPLSCKRPTLSGAGRNSNCGFSPIIFSQDCQKERCQESCQRGLIFPLFPAVPDAGAMSMNYLFRLRSSLRESRQSRAQRRVGDMSY